MADQPQTIYGIPVVVSDQVDPDGVYLVARQISEGERHRFKRQWGSLFPGGVQIMKLPIKRSECEAE